MLITQPAKDSLCGLLLRSLETVSKLFELENFDSIANEEGVEAI